jgi:serine/threonine-protein kinase RsbW
MSKQIFRLALKSTYEESEKVPDYVSDIQKKASLNDDETSSLMLLLSEAVTNGIEHGNKFEPTKTIEIVIEVSEKSIISTVTDEGDGFDPKSTKDPLKEENLLIPGGRGIFLLEEMSDHVEYLDNGRKVRFKINRD